MRKSELIAAVQKEIPRQGGSDSTYAASLVSAGSPTWTSISNQLLATRNSQSPKPTTQRSGRVPSSQALTVGIVACLDWRCCPGRVL